jgi:hypothetical protein
MGLVLIARMQRPVLEIISGNEFVADNDDSIPEYSPSIAVSADDFWTSTESDREQTKHKRSYCN